MLCMQTIAVSYDFRTKLINTFCGQSVEFLGAFEKLQKAMISLMLV